MKNYLTKNWIIISVLLITILFAIFLIFRVNQLEQELKEYSFIDELTKAMPSPEPFEISEPSNLFYDKEGNLLDVEDFIYY